MPTREDRRAAVVLLSLTAAGLLLRLVTDHTAPPGELGYRPAAEARPSRDSVVARAGRLSRPLAAGERVDPDQAPAEELARLPRVGPGLAARIVADRAARGPFGSLDALGRVPGIGPTTLEGLRGAVTFSGPARVDPIGRERVGKVRLNSASAEELMRLPGIGPALAAAILEDRRRNGPYRALDDLARVRGIGARLLERWKDRILVP
jgi:competence ComEA-like helix-hairpin-helix protein